MKRRPAAPSSVAGVEEDRRDVDAALQLLEQREGPVDGEERAGPQDEDDVAQRVGVGRHARGDEVDERRVLGEDGVDRLDDGRGALLALGVEPLLERALRAHRLVEALGEGDARDALALLREPRLEQRHLPAQLELLLRVVAEDRVRHVVVGADARAAGPGSSRIGSRTLLDARVRGRSCDHPLRVLEGARAGQRELHEAAGDLVVELAGTGAAGGARAPRRPGA